MRWISVLAAISLLAACGGPETSQANNAQANISLDSRSTDTAKPAALGPPVATQKIFAGPVSGADAIRVMHQRHEGMETIGKTAKAIKGQLDSGSPDLAAVHASASRISQLLQQANGWFPAGTGAEVGKTGAKANIWQGSAIAPDFLAKLATAQRAAQAFETAASGSDASAVEQRFTELGGTCKACHDKYRMDMHH